MAFPKKLTDPALTFEAWDIDTCLLEISNLKEKCQPDTKAYEFYHTMENSFMALRQGLQENRRLRAWVDLLGKRLDVLERLFLVYTKSDHITANDIADLIRDTKH